MRIPLLVAIATLAFGCGSHVDDAGTSDGAVDTASSSETSTSETSTTDTSSADTSGSSCKPGESSCFTAMACGKPCSVCSFCQSDGTWGPENGDACYFAGMACKDTGPGPYADVTPEAADDACPSSTVTATCVYAGYGTTCPVACSASDSCKVNLQVTWTGGGYCCAPTVNYTDCVCHDGHLECPETPSAAPKIPTTYCEFCSSDAGAG